MLLTVIQQVRDVQAEGGQDGVIHFEVLSESRHEQQEAGRSLVGGAIKIRIVQIDRCGFLAPK